MILQRNSCNESTGVNSFSRRYVLTLAVMATAMLFGHTQAGAGYVAVAETAAYYAASSLAHPAVSSLADFGTFSSIGCSPPASQSSPDTNNPHPPSHPVTPSLKLTHLAHTVENYKSCRNKLATCRQGALAAARAAFLAGCQEIFKANSELRSFGWHECGDGSLCTHVPDINHRAQTELARTLAWHRRATKAAFMDWCL
jgi:hypothetical protein